VIYTEPKSQKRIRAHWGWVRSPGRNVAMINSLPIIFCYVPRREMFGCNNNPSHVTWRTINSTIH